MIEAVPQAPVAVEPTIDEQLYRELAPVLIRFATARRPGPIEDAASVPDRVREVAEAVTFVTPAPFSYRRPSVDMRVAEYVVPEQPGESPAVLTIHYYPGMGGSVDDNLRRWLKSQWLAPNRLARASLVDTVRSLYIPYWTFDADARCPWEAEAGHYYYVSVPHRDAQGRTVMRQERRVRWEPASGEIQHTFDDEPVPGSHGIDLGLLRQVEPFPTKELVPYDTAFLSGHVVEHYQVVLFEAANASQQQMHAKLEQLCAAEVPGDTYRNLVIHPVYSNQTFKHILVPVWLLTYDYGAKKYQVVANGYTGAIAGQRPYSAWKIFFLVVAILIVVLVLAYAANN